MIARSKKFIPLAKHAFDLKSIHKTQQAVNALLNAQVVVGKAAQAHLADGNTIYEIPPQVDKENFYPFKIYKPDFSLLTPQGNTFDDSGNPVAINIDSTVPTNLPTTVNPKTDGWRIWAVRTGMVSLRSYEFAQTDVQFFFPGGSGSAQVNLSDFSTSFEVSSGCDGIGIGFQQGLPYDFDPADGTAQAPVSITPIVINADPDEFGLYGFALFLKTTSVFAPEANTPATLMGLSYDAHFGGELVFPTPTDSSFIPIGVISSLGWGFYNGQGNPKYLTAYQIQYGNVINRYGIFENNFDDEQLNYSANLNFRGNWQTDLIVNSCFYPGDLIQYQRELDFTATSTVNAPGVGTVTTTVVITDPDAEETGASLFVTELYMATVVGFTDDPTFDPNFVKISGVDFTPNENPTPNTNQS